MQSYYFCFLNSFWQMYPEKEQTWTLKTSSCKGTVPLQTMLFCIVKFQACSVTLSLWQLPLFLSSLKTFCWEGTTRHSNQNTTRSTWNSRTKICPELRLSEMNISDGATWGLGARDHPKLQPFYLVQIEQVEQRLKFSMIQFTPVEQKDHVFLIIISVSQWSEQRRATNAFRFAQLMVG